MADFFIDLKTDRVYELGLGIRTSPELNHLGHDCFLTTRGPGDVVLVRFGKSFEILTEPGLGEIEEGLFVLGEDRYLLQQGMPEYRTLVSMKLDTGVW